MSDDTKTTSPDNGCPVTHAEILDALKGRGLWELRQATWYDMRNDGLRRRNKPWPNAADMHYPLADTQIEKLKPAYVQQLFSTDTIATFTSLQAGAQRYQSAAAQRFDYELKQCTNFEEEVTIAIDRMLQAGKCVVKVWWDAEREQIRWEAINPLYVIVPHGTGRIETADWIVHVQHFSKHAFKRLAQRNGWQVTDAQLEAMTTGMGASSSATNYETEKYVREGMTKPSNKEQVVVWEVFYRTPSGQWWVRTYSPTDEKHPLREDFGLPYNKGIFAGKQPPPPFFEINTEARDRGYYDSRGICERVAPFEASLCKTWNTIKDHQTLTSAPVFNAPNGLPQTANLRMVPGQIMPFALEAVAMPPLPGVLMQSMVNDRMVAEQLVGAPDFGTGQQIDTKQRKTATEVSLIGQQMGASQDMRARQFRREMGAGLRMGWAIFLQYRQNQLEFFYLDELSQLPPEALGIRYQIELSGSGDNYNRVLVLQKAQGRFQMFRGDPFINQGELRKSVLDADDPRQTKRLFMDAGTQQAEQLEDQAQEISIMLLGFPAQVRETDDDLAHIKSIAGFTQRRAHTGEPMSAETLAQLSQHVQAHLNALKNKQPDVFKQQGQALMNYARQLQAKAQAAAQHEQIQMGAEPMQQPPQGIAA